MRVLVTGGTGFVGANLVRRLLDDGHEVHLIVRPQARTWRLAGVEGALQLHRGRLGEDGIVDAACAAVRPEWIFHLAAHGAYSFETDYVAMARTNVVGAAELIAAASRHGCAALVLSGSSAEYGRRRTSPAETELPAPNNHYAATKAAASWMATIASADPAACPIVVCRLYSVYGPWEDPRRLMPTLLRHALAGTWPPLADPETMRDFVFTEDAVAALLMAAHGAADHRGAVYNVGTGAGTSLRELTDTVRRTLGVAHPPEFGVHPGRPWDARMWWVSDPGLIERELGWRATTSLETGIRTFAAWLEQHRDLYPPVPPAPAAAVPG